MEKCDSSRVIIAGQLLANEGHGSDLCFMSTDGI